MNINNPGEVLYPLTMREMNVAEGIDRLDTFDIAIGGFAYPEGHPQRYTQGGWEKVQRRGFGHAYLHLTIQETG